MDGKPDALVICSTLNQITNYLVIKKFIKEYGPLKIYNITFDKDARKKMNKNINIDDWDKQLKNSCKKKFKIDDCNITNICLGESDFYNIGDIVYKVMCEIDKFDIENKKTIYWHITGGQRIIAMAAGEIIKERPQDKWIYMEGNVEKLLEYNNQLKEVEINDYDDKKLEFKDAFKLAGFNLNEDLKSTTILNISKELGLNNNELKNEIEFYNKLYDIFIQPEDKAEKIEMELYDGEEEQNKRSFRNWLIYSNSNNETTKKERVEGENSERQQFIYKLFEKLLDKHNELKKEICGYDILNSQELKNNYPAGYILEKIAACKIYDVLRSKNFAHNINQIGLSIKAYFDDEEKIKHKDKTTVDELDIALLSSTGKIINFECKVGGMEGDNAKSHNYTTYRLAGVFGMPILISPLLQEEISELKEEEVDKSKKEIDKLKAEFYKKQYSTIRAAERAELYVWGIDSIENNLEELLKRRQEEGKCTRKAN